MASAPSASAVADRARQVTAFHKTLRDTKNSGYHDGDVGKPGIFVISPQNSGRPAVDEHLVAVRDKNAFNYYFAGEQATKAYAALEKLCAEQKPEIDHYTPPTERRAWTVVEQLELADAGGTPSLAVDGRHWNDVVLGLQMCDLAVTVTDLEKTKLPA